MIDNLLYNLPRAKSPEASLQQYCGSLPPLITTNGFSLLTLHRPSNVDDPVVLKRLLEVLVELGRDIPLIWPLHPRTSGQIEKHGLGRYLEGPELVTIPPAGYLP